MSTHQGLFYVKSFGNYIHWTFMLIFLCNCFIYLFIFLFIYLYTHNNWIRTLLKRFIWAKDGTLTSSITLGQSGPGSNEVVLHTPQISITRKSQSNTVLCHPQITSFREETYLFVGEYDQCILRPPHKLRFLWWRRHSMIWSQSFCWYIRLNL